VITRPRRPTVCKIDHETGKAGAKSQGGYSDSEFIAPRILDIDTRQKLVVRLVLVPHMTVWGKGESHLVPGRAPHLLYWLSCNLPEVASGNESALIEVFKPSFLETYETFVVKPEIFEPEGELDMITLQSCYYLSRGKGSKI
jgi:hypothetical protein